MLFRRVRGQVLEATNGEHRVPTVASERPHEYQSLVGEHYLGVLPAAEAVADVATAPSAPAPDVAAVDVERLDVAELRLPGRAGRRERADRDRPAVRGRPRFGSELVVRHVRMFGYTDLSLQRASSTFICQSTPRCVPLTSMDHADTSRCSVARSPRRRPRRHWRVIELSSFSAMFSQLPCFGVW